ncbi:MAG: helix-turn-helix transcriptional regulator [Candidatus Gastranaerophilales bacterium]|nr:helix-turn-helix transcriptional regulator [Candidatus Gastranaerophilales bacterium]
MSKKEEEKLMYYLTMHIREIRKQKNLTQEELSELLNVYREHIAKIETRKRNLTLKLLCIVLREVASHSVFVL